MTHPTFSPATSPQQLLEQFPVDFLHLTPLEQRVSIALYRLLADGEPVTLDRLAGAVSRPQHEIAAMLVMSFLRCDPSRVQEDVISNFCHYVFFFSSLEGGPALGRRTPRDLSRLARGCLRACGAEERQPVP
jgi:hypothetical protein